MIAPPIALAPIEAADTQSPFDWPAFGLQDDIRPALATAMATGAPAVLATLYDVVGGAPRGVGAQMLFAGGDMAGFLSGGCVEADVALHAQAVMADGGPRRIVYGEGGPADIQLACGSRVDLFVERIAPEAAAARRLLELTAARRPAVWLSDGRIQGCIAAGDDFASLPWPLCTTAEAAAKAGGCGYGADPFIVFRAYTPPLRLMVLGGDPIALAVVRLAVDMGVETVLIRPKGPQATPLPSLRYLRSSLGEALEATPADPWTAIAVLTHDADQEHAALKAALTSEAGYIGALGSRRRIPERNARLSAAGVSPTDMSRVRAPIGLPIGGKSPWEIAVSIIAEIIAQTPPKPRNDSAPKALSTSTS